MADETPGKKVDEDWKRRVADEKTVAGTAPAAAPHRGGTPAAPAKTAGAAAPPKPPRRGAARGDFLQLVNMLAAQALMALGQMENPMTGQVRQDLQQARSAIDVLVMLQEKTQGNLTSEEDQTLSQVVRELQMAYVQLAT